jgi:hypothetical protein
VLLLLLLRPPPPWFPPSPNDDPCRLHPRPPGSRPQIKFGGGSAWCWGYAVDVTTGSVASYSYFVRHTTYVGNLRADTAGYKPPCSIQERHRSMVLISPVVDDGQQDVRSEDVRSEDVRSEGSQLHLTRSVGAGTSHPPSTIKLSGSVQN